MVHHRGSDAPASAWSSTAALTLGAGRGPRVRRQSQPRRSAAAPAQPPATERAARSGEIAEPRRVFSQFFIERPIFATVISIILVWPGWCRMTDLPVEQYPTITPVQVTVSATYPGADSQTLADSVAAPIEAQINGVDNMLYMSSTSSSSGQLTADRLLHARHRPGHRAGAGAEPGQPGDAAASCRRDSSSGCRCRRSRPRS